MSLTVQAGLTHLTRYFKERSVQGAGREARLLLAHLMGVDPGRLTVLSQDPLSPDLLEDAYAQASRRAYGGEPMSHIIGYREFWGRRFVVDRRVLDPRPETEILIETALEEPFSEILDLGTGSGCIIATLLAERPNAVGIGSDLSERALEVAKENAASLGVAERVGFLESDWFKGIGGRFDLIVSNPPYIALDEMPDLAPELGYEPRIALTDEGDGLGAYRVIAAGLRQHLAPGGRVLLEIGPTQAAAVSALLLDAGLENVAVHPDLDGRDRVISAHAPT